MLKLAPPPDLLLRNDTVRVRRPRERQPLGRPRVLLFQRRQGFRRVALIRRPRRGLGELQPAVREAGRRRGPQSHGRVALGASQRGARFRTHRDADDGGPTELCLPPLLFDDASTVFTPEDVKENDRRLCGYNFMSYVTYDALMSRFGGTTVSDFDIEWEPSAYAKNKAGKYDYSLVEKSTETLAKLPRFKPLDSEQLKAMGAM